MEFLFALSLAAVVAVAIAQTPTAELYPRAASTFEIPLPTPTPQSDNVTANYRLFGFHHCSTQSGWEKAILDALLEKDTITSTVWEPDWHEKAIVDFFGSPANLKTLSAGDSTYRWKIRQNFKNLWNYGNGWWGSGHQMEVFCGDGSFDKLEYQDYCATKPGHVHFVNDYTNGKDGIMFCNTWFNLPTLSAAMDIGQNSHDKYDLSLYNNRALSWIAALIQKHDVGTWPTSGTIVRKKWKFPVYNMQWATTPSSLKYVGSLRSTSGIVEKSLVQQPDTWAWAAMAVYVTEKIGTYPVRPYITTDLDFEWIDR